MNPDEQKRTIYQALKILHPEDDCVFELCAFSPKVQRHSLWEGFAAGRKVVIAGWYNNKIEATETAAALDAIGCEAIYTTLNPCNPALMGRACNRLKVGVDRTKDADIIRLSRLLIDIDVDSKPTGVSATDAEHALALEHAAFVAQSLSAKGWPAPLIRADSGNGAHLIFALDLPNTGENAALLKSVLQGLGELYAIHRDGVTLKIDSTTFNPARLTKLYGTHVRKGDNIPERPHRRSQIL
jgi:hypothetical protein